jgi:putative tricarboxylic transport membrane protein
MTEIVDIVLPALFNLFTLTHLSMLLLGVFMGLVFGILPGLGGVAGLSLILPFTFGMEPSAALAMMIGLLAPLNTSDVLPAVLMGIPGSAGGQTTVLDGFPMAKRGEAARALSAAFSASMVGGVFGALVLSFAVFGAKPIILSMGFGELMMITVFALTMVGTLTGKSAIKGVAACGLGLLLGTIGGAPATGESRMTFESAYLIEGIPLIILGLGLFAFPEVIDLLRRHVTISQTGKLGTGWLDGLRDMIRHRWLVLRTSMLGAIIGMLPGLGSSAAEWITYGHVVQTSKDKSQFGKGDVRSVIGVEGANNAVTGGALVPTLLFGIPGSGSMALLLGGFVMIGIQPGPSMVSTNLDVTFTIIWSLAIANIVGAGACFLMSNSFARITTVPYALVAPVMIAILFFAAFQATRHWNDLIALVVIGMIGIYMKRFGWARPALLIGFVLSDALEASVYRAMQVYGWSFLQRPIVIIIVILTIVSVVAAWRTRPRVTSETADLMSGASEVIGVRYDMASARAAPPLVDRIPQVLFSVGLLAFVGLVIYENYSLSYLGGIFPLISGFVCLALIAIVIAFQIFSSKERTVMSDEEYSDPPTGRSNLYFLAWFAGALAAMALVGFNPAIAVFIFAFATVVAGRPLWRNALLAIVPVVVFGIMAHVLNLYYPTGLLERLVTLPQWLG